MYLVADPDTDRDGDTEFAICVKRHSYIDDFNGERYPGGASNYLCDLKIGSSVGFVGPIGDPFELLTDRQAGILMISMGGHCALPRDDPPHPRKTRQLGRQGTRFYGAKTGLDMLYMNDANQDLRSTAISRPQGLPGDQPAPDAPVEPDKALAQDAAKVWEMVQAPGTHIHLAGADDLLHRVEDDLAGMAGSIAAWRQVKGTLRGSDRWHEVLY
ncbi:MAG: oxidoreductase [Thiobacillus sp.]|nr:oxidoreductase [Thiobacillus sp.]MDP2977474.1 oxidoreductase [Thiobacillus sp.]